MAFNLKQNPDGSTSLINSADSNEVIKFTSDNIATINGNSIPKSVSFTAAAGAANVCEVTIKVLDGSGTAIAAPFTLDIWLSDAATGAGLTATTASGAVAAKAASGADFSTFVSKKALRVQTLATGIYILSITDTAKTGFYVCAQLPGNGKAQIGTQLITANYG